MELHGGTITVTSEGLGKGSCFTVELPAASSPIACDVNATSADISAPDNSAIDPLTSQSRNSLSFLSRLWLGVMSCSLTQLFGRLSTRVVVHNDPPEYQSELSTIRKFNLGGNDRDSHNSSLANDIDLVDLDQLLDTNSAALAVNFRSNPFGGRKPPQELSPSPNPEPNPKDDSSSEKEDDKSSTVVRKFHRILIVDDIPMNRKMLRRLLYHRFEVCEEAGNGEQVVDMVKDLMASGEEYDVITIDYQMPIMDGVTATSTMRKLGYKGNIVGITGNAMSEDVNGFIASGANIVLTKPLSFAALEEYLATLA